jgi:hypothetical protein
MTVTTQDTGRTDREARYAYVIREKGQPVYVSAYRYRTPEGAYRAGQADAEACAALQGELS